MRNILLASIVLSCLAAPASAQQWDDVPLRDEILGRTQPCTMVQRFFNNPTCAIPVYTGEDEYHDEALDIFPPAPAFPEEGYNRDEIGQPEDFAEAPPPATGSCRITVDAEGNSHCQ